MGNLEKLVFLADCALQLPNYSMTLSEKSVFFEVPIGRWNWIWLLPCALLLLMPNKAEAQMTQAERDCAVSLAQETIQHNEAFLKTFDETVHKFKEGDACQYSMAVLIPPKSYAASMLVTPLLQAMLPKLMSLAAWCRASTKGRGRIDLHIEHAVRRQRIIGRIQSGRDGEMIRECVLQRDLIFVGQQLHDLRLLRPKHRFGQHRIADAVFGMPLTQQERGLVRAFYSGRHTIAITAPPCCKVQLHGAMLEMALFKHGRKGRGVCQ